MINCKDRLCNLLNINDSDYISFAELTAYCFGIECIMVNIESMLRACFCNYRNLYDFNFYQFLLGNVFIGNTDINTSFNLSKILGHNWLSCNINDFSFWLKKSVGLSDYSINGNKLCISHVSKSKYKNLGWFLSNWCPFWMDVEYIGNSACFDNWDSFGNCWNDYDGFGLQFDVVDKLEV